MQQTNSSFAGRDILVVEDEFLIALTLQQMLEDLGCSKVRIAHTVREAMAEIEDTSPDCALLDLNLGKEYSFVIGDALRERDIPYIFCTAHAANAELFFPHDIDKPRLNKPVTVKDLKQALTSALNV